MKLSHMYEKSSTLLRYYPLVSPRSFFYGILVSVLLLILLLGSIGAPLYLDNGEPMQWSIASVAELGFHVLMFSVVTLPYLFIALIIILSGVLISSWKVDNRKCDVIDPDADFTREQKTIASVFAWNRCEMERFPWIRCREVTGDVTHFYPHSKGGATEVSNSVWSCAQCRTLRENRTPTLAIKRRIERRRIRYFPDYMPVSCGSIYSPPIEDTDEDDAVVEVVKESNKKIPSAKKKSSGVKKKSKKSSSAKKKKSSSAKKKSK